jgi:hypothetical protein
MMRSSHPHDQRFWAPVVLLSLIGATACSGSQDPELSGPSGTPEVHIPEATEWVDRGSLFEAGEPGDWDLYLWGGFTATAVEKAGEYLLYYQGSSDFREEYDPTVCWRSIGLAHGTLADGLEKFGNAPVLTWRPNDGCEEGAAAGAALVSEDEVLIYYGANTLTGRTTVSADVRLARSGDGRSFRDVGVVLDHSDENLWGHGDELFPVLALSNGAERLLYYVPNGTLNGRQLAVARGTDAGRLDDSQPVRDPAGWPVRVWGPAGYGRVGPSLVALFLKDGPEADTEVRMVDPSEPHLVGDPVRTYSFDDMTQATVLLDEEREMWLMFYRGEGFYGLKTAPLRMNPDRVPAG